MPLLGQSRSAFATSTAPPPGSAATTLPTTNPGPPPHHHCRKPQGSSSPAGLAHFQEPLMERHPPTCLPFPKQAALLVHPTQPLALACSPVFGGSRARSRQGCTAPASPRPGRTLPGSVDTEKFGENGIQSGRKSGVSRYQSVIVTP